MKVRKYQAFSSYLDPVFSVTLWRFCLKVNMVQIITHVEKGMWSESKWVNFLLVPSHKEADRATLQLPIEMGFFS